MGDTRRRGILSPGTQVVARTEVRGSGGAILRPKGTLGVVVRSPADIEHAYTITVPRRRRSRLEAFRLPDRPDYGKAGALLLRARRMRAGGAVNETLQVEVREHPYPLLFATVSGAHLYGFPSPDSDFDLLVRLRMKTPDASGGRLPA